MWLPIHRPADRSTVGDLSEGSAHCWCEGDTDPLRARRCKRSADAADVEIARVDDLEEAEGDDPAAVTPRNQRPSPPGCAAKVPNDDAVVPTSDGSLDQPATTIAHPSSA